MQCKHCQYEWNYTGNKEKNLFYVTCPRCLRKSRLNNIKKDGDQLSYD